MRKVFWDNPYQHTLTTKVTTVFGNRILLEETIASLVSFAEYDEAKKLKT